MTAAGRARHAEAVLNHLSIGIELMAATGSEASAYLVHRDGCP